MPKSKPSAVAKHRRVLRQRGLKRIELRVPAIDAELFKQIAASILGAETAKETRAYLRRRFSSAESADFKDYLASAPLEGIDLGRRSDTGRDVDL